MNIKTIKSGLWALMMVFGIAGYFILDWYEAEQKSRCGALNLKLVHLRESVKNISADRHQDSQIESQALEKNARVLLQYLKVLLKQGPRDLTFHRIKYDDHSLMVDGVSRSSEAISRLMAALSVVVSMPVIIRALSQTPNGAINFELVAESIGARS